MNISAPKMYFRAGYYKRSDKVKVLGMLLSFGRPFTGATIAVGPGMVQVGWGL